MDRRGFLRSGLVLAAGIAVGDEVMEAFERLTHRKVFPSAAIGYNPAIITDSEISGLVRKVYEEYRVKTQGLVTPILGQMQKVRAQGSVQSKVLYFDVAMTGYRIRL